MPDLLTYSSQHKPLLRGGAEREPGVGALQSGSRAHVPNYSAVFPFQVERNKAGKGQQGFGIGSDCTVAAAWWDRKGNRP